MAGHRPLLSDEHVMVRRRGDGWVAASTPFWGSYAKPGRARQAPLQCLWSLRQAPANEIRVTGPQEGLRTVLDNAVLACREPALKRAVFDVGVDLSRDVDSAELHFTPEPAIWEMIDDARLAVH